MTALGPIGRLGRWSAQARWVFVAWPVIALGLADALTLLHGGAVTEDAYNEAAKFFPGSLLAELVVVIMGISAWNRVLLVSGVAPTPDH